MGTPNGLRLSRGELNTLTVLAAFTFVEGARHTGVSPQPRVAWHHAKNLVAIGLAERRFGRDAAGARVRGYAITEAGRNYPPGRTE